MEVAYSILPEWLPHRRSNGEDAPEAVDDKDRAMTAVQNEPALTQCAR
jgi:hypothetical protein